MELHNEKTRMIFKSLPQPVQRYLTRYAEDHLVPAMGAFHIGSSRKALFKRHCGTGILIVRTLNDPPSVQIHEICAVCGVGKTGSKHPVA
jgi:hypothetical protein